MFSIQNDHCPLPYVNFLLVTSCCQPKSRHLSSISGSHEDQVGMSDGSVSGEETWDLRMFIPKNIQIMVKDTVDGRNPANQLRLVVYPNIYRNLHQEYSCHLLKLNFGISFRETTVAKSNAQLYKTVIDVAIQ